MGFANFQHALYNSPKCSMIVTTLILGKNRAYKVSFLCSISNQTLSAFIPLKTGETEEGARGKNSKPKLWRAQLSRRRRQRGVDMISLLQLHTNFFMQTKKRGEGGIPTIPAEQMFIIRALSYRRNGIQRGGGGRLPLQINSRSIKGDFFCPVL